MISKFFHYSLFLSLLLMGSSQWIQAQNPCQVSFIALDSANTVYFHVTDTGALNPIYYWQITDGSNNTTTTTTTTSSNFTFTFSGASNNHFACVTLLDSLTNCQTTYCDSVMTSGGSMGNCNVYFNYSDSGNTVFLNAVGSGALNPIYYWQLTDGNNNTTTSTTTTNPNFAFTFSGASNNHFACVTILDSLTNCQATYCDSLMTGGSGTGNNCNNASVSYTITPSYNNPSYYSLAAVSSGFVGGVDYTWTVYGANTVTYTGQVISAYNNYFVCVTATDSFGCTATYCDTLTGATPACANFSATASSTFISPNNVAFSSTVNSGSGNYSYLWTFDIYAANPATSTLASPAYTYPANSSNTVVKVEVWDNVTNCYAFAYDTVNVGGSGCNLNALSLTLNHDNYAAETSWDILDHATNTIVASGLSLPFMNNSTIVQNLCLPTGCYTLNVYDSWGDGMCCNYGAGSYDLSDGNGSLVSGGSFGFVESTNFCIGGASNPCGNIPNTTISHTLGANGAVTFSSVTTGNVYPTDYQWLVDGIVVANTPTATVTLANGVHSYCLIVDTMGLCSTTICDSLLINNANTGPQGCAGIVPDMTVVQDSIDPYQLYVQPILNNVPAGASFIFYWSFGDNSGAFGSQAAHTYNNYGSYNLCFVAIDSASGCIVNYCDTITLDSSGNFSRFLNKPGFRVTTLSPILNSNINTTSLAAAEWEATLFPNPAQTVVNLQLNSPVALEAQVSIISVTGQVVQQQTIQQAEGSSQVTLPVAELPAGVYFVRLESGQQQQTLKFIKE